MNKIRSLIPWLGFLALAALFFKLPDTPNLFGFFGCKACSSSDPYLPLIGSGYFALLIAVAWLFPLFPKPLVARGGFLWAILLSLTLTYIDYPNWCAACLIGHVCNILIWGIWLAAPFVQEVDNRSSFRVRLCMTILAPIFIIALFSGLNLTFMAYGYKIQGNFSASGLQFGEAVPYFSAKTTGGITISYSENERPDVPVVINFVSPDCPYCKEQLVVLDAVAVNLATESCRFINISPVLTPDLLKHSTASEWVEDKEGKLLKLFKVTGYPTAFVIGADGKVSQVVQGLPEQFRAMLITNLIGVKGLHHRKVVEN